MPTIDQWSVFPASLRRFVVALTGALLFLAPGSRGAIPFKPVYEDPLVEPYRWQTFAMLSGKGCRCMVEDRTGALWFGVSSGVIRYDGMNWSSAPVDPRFPSTPVVALCAAQDGTIFAGTPRGISRCRPGAAWQPLALDLDFADTLDYPNNKYPIIETADCSIWIGTHQGLLRIAGEHYAIFRPEGVFPLESDGAGIRRGAGLERLPSFDVYALFADSTARLWVGLRDGKIYTLESAGPAPAAAPVWRRQDTAPGFALGEFPQILRTRDGRLFVVSQQSHTGVNIFAAGRWHEVDLGRMFGCSNVHTGLLESKHGTLLVGGLGFLYALKEGRWSIYESADLPIPANRLFLYETRDGSLWIGGLGSEIKRLDYATRMWQTMSGLIFEAESPRGECWFLSAAGQAVRCDSAMTRWTAFDVRDGLMDAPGALYFTRGGELWAAGSHDRVAATARFDGMRWHLQEHPRISWGLDYRTHFEAMDGSLWFGGNVDMEQSRLPGCRGGLVRLRPAAAAGAERKADSYYFDDHFPLSGTYGIGESPDSLLWVGQLGLFTLDPADGRWTTVNGPRALVENFIDCISTSPAHSLWMGTRSNGVFCRNARNGAWLRYTSENGLSSNTIISILACSDSNVWVATDQDICHFDGQSWSANVFPDVRRMTNEGGTLRRTADGSLWINHVSRTWYRRAVRHSPHASDGEFTTIRYRPDGLPPETVITYAQDRIAPPGNVLISWAALDPWENTPGQQLKYSCRLDDQPWSEFSSKNSEVLLAVGDGHHSFEVRARDRDLNLDTQPARVTFYVIPPVWKQSWFIALMVSFLVIIAGFVYRLYHRNRTIQELSDARQNLFTNISHEFRTPLTLIMGQLPHLQRALGGEAGLKPRLEIISANCARLLRQVTLSLDFQKMTAGRLTFTATRADLIEVIHKSAADLHPMAAEKGIDFRCESAISVLFMEFDAEKMEKILFNLLSNAIKFTPAGGTIRLTVDHAAGREPNSTVKTRQPHQQEQGGWLAIRVADSGIGIPKNKQKYVFDRFYQIEDPRGMQRGGTGVGLALTRELVALHGGEIRVDSEFGRGSTFTVFLPVAACTASAAPPPSADAGAASPAARPSGDARAAADAAALADPAAPGRIATAAGREMGRKILLVEDNSEMRRYIREELAEDGRIYEAENGAVACEMIPRILPDIIVSDVMMPEMDGLELCRRIKSDERCSHIPVILLTARSSHPAKMKGLETGADDYLTKPFSAEELRARIDNLLISRMRLQARFRRQIVVQPNEIAITSADEKFLRRVMAVSEAHLGEAEFNVDEFSREIGMSRVSLYHKLRTLTGYSVQEFIHVMRLKRGAQLLRDSDLNVTQIAYQVGFKDASHFTKLFKKHFGQSPSEFHTKKEH
ncbi:MAG TPA: response regulator [bacterium]|nr:response regulator [bacterium]HPR87934.1 response regulator [bacterium]